MEKKFLGQRIKRNEDPRILTGRAKYIADIIIIMFCTQLFCGVIIRMQN